MSASICCFKRTAEIKQLEGRNIDFHILLPEGFLTHANSVMDYMAWNYLKYYQNHLFMLLVTGGNLFKILYKSTVLRLWARFYIFFL